MPTTVELAGALQALSDDALDALVRTRHVPQHVASYFDVAEQLRRPESVAAALEGVRDDELVALATGATTPRLDALGLGVAGVALDEARRQAAAAPAGEGARETPTASPDDARAAERAFATVLLVGEVVRAALEQPIQMLARGAVAMADARRLAEALATDADAVLDAVAIARAAGLLAVRDAALVASTAAEGWLGAPLPARWLRLRDGWLAAIEWAERAVATAPDAAPAAARFPLAGAATLERLATAAARAARLGIRDGAATSLAGDGADAVLDALVPHEIDRAYVQPDLSIVVPGPLQPALESRVRLVADLEQRGTASTYRMSLASLSRGLAAGEDEASILGLLDAISLTGVPQPVAYLVRDAAARFGSVRVLALADGPDRTAVRAEPALIAELAVDHGLAPLRMREESPRRLVTRAEPAMVLAALRARRYPAAVEDAEGELLAPARHVAEVLAPPPTPLVQRLRGSGFDVGGEERAWLERRLQVAARERVSVQVRVDVGGEERELALLPLGVANGRLRARDLASDVERTLPVTAITHLTGVP
ncbi:MULTISPECIES: helicase-associated domain-containing protein [unclassified Agrococcus]|uniref:helicase-associated domain-containing protein n=1 Tax=unclassified Agrococcus TaxID=2615065 RepID=UPI00360DBC7F